MHFLDYKDEVRHSSSKKFGHKHGREPSARPTIHHDIKLMETGYVLRRKGAGEPQISEEKIESVRARYVCTRSPSKSIHMAYSRLQMPRSAIHKGLHKSLPKRKTL